MSEKCHTENNNNNSDNPLTSRLTDGGKRQSIKYGFLRPITPSLHKFRLNSLEAGVSKIPTPLRSCEIEILSSIIVIYLAEEGTNSILVFHIILGGGR